MKKTSRILILALALALMLSGTASAATYGVIRMPTSDGSVNIRTGPSTGYRIRGWAVHGDKVLILSANKKWDKVRVLRTGVTGYMYNKYVTQMVNATTLKKWGTMARIKTKYASSTVCLRKGPSTSYGVISYLTPNNALAILGKYGSWYEVQIVPGDTTGYVYKDYITNGANGVTTAKVNLRKSGSSSSRKLRTAPSGSSVVILKVGSKWSKVIYSGKTGYMYNKYIAVTNLADQ